jgi:hypothetical protein
MAMGETTFLLSSNIKTLHKGSGSVASSLSGPGGALSLCLAGQMIGVRRVCKQKNPAREDNFEKMNKCGARAFPGQLMEGKSGGKFLAKELQN